MTSTTTQIISPTWIAPVTPDGALLLDHSLVIEGSRIAALLPQAETQARFPDAPNLKLEGHLVTPGFVNVHGHAAMTLLRGIADDREMMDWLTNWIWPIEGKLVNEQFVYDGTRLAAMEMIMGGTTCAAGMNSDSPATHSAEKPKPAKPRTMPAAKTTHRLASSSGQG